MKDLQATTASTPLFTVFLLAVSFTLVFSHHSIAGKIYRWKDNGGTVHYSEHPPQATKATLLNITTGKPGKKKSIETSIDTNGSEKNQETEQNSQPTDQNTPTSQAPSPSPTPLKKPKPNSKYCERARHNLKTLNERARIRQKGTDGEMRFLNEDEVEEQKKSAKQAIKSYC